MTRGILTSAFEPSPETLDAITRRFTKLLSDDVLLDVVIDARLIAGVTVDIAGRLYDGSFKGQLEQLRANWIG